MRQQTPTELQLHITRREFCQSTAAVALATAVLGVSALPRFAAPRWRRPSRRPS